MAHFAADALQGIGSVRLDAVVDHAEREGRDQVEARIEAYAVRDLVLSGSEQWPVRIARARADVDVRLARHGDRIAASLRVRSGDTAIETDFGDTPLGRALADVLEGADRLSLEVEVAGPLADPDITIESDLDAALRRRAEQLVDDRMATLERRIGERIDARIAGPRASLDARLEDLGAVRRMLQSRVDEARQLLSTALGAPGIPGLPGGLGGES
jgi:hypothetical protein